MWHDTSSSVLFWAFEHGNGGEDHSVAYLYEKSVSFYVLIRDILPQVTHKYAIYLQ